MGSLSKFDIGVIVGFVLLALLGAGGWWYTSGWVAEAQEKIDQSHNKLILLNKERFTPSKGNIDKLEENAAKLSEAINPIVTAKLAPGDSPLPQIKPMGPAWRSRSG